MAMELFIAMLPKTIFHSVNDCLTITCVGSKIISNLFATRGLQVPTFPAINYHVKKQSRYYCRRLVLQIKK
jgi:hypothetical protein